MKHPYMKATALALLAAAAINAPEASASVANANKALHLQEAKAVRPFRGETPWGFAGNPDATPKRRVAVDKTAAQFSKLDNFDYLEGPDGSTWFYVADYEIESEQVSEWYTEERIVAYTFTIYDSSFKEIGTIKDKVTLAPGETRVAHAVLDPTVTRHFFNSDDQPEVMVYMAMNTSASLGYKVNYYNKAYTLGGEKDADGNDRCIAVLPGRCADTFNAGTPANEDFFLTLVDDIEPNMDDYTDFIDFVNAYKTEIKIYRSAGVEGEPELVFEKDIYLTRYPGDTTDGIYLITKDHNGTPYFIFSQYEKPYFIDPTGFATDENATPDNCLMIEAFSFNGKMNPVSTTRIPVVIEQIPDGVAYTFYSIGSVAWKHDIDMTVNGTPSAPAYLVARDVTTAANLEEIESSYEIYGNDGKLVRVLAQGTDGISLLPFKTGEEPHALFVNMEDEKFTFNFRDLYSGNNSFSIDQDNDGDPLTAACSRISTADGKYKYAFTMQYDELENGNDIKRVAWFDQDGTFDRIDRIMMGKDVMYAQVNMNEGALSPTLYDDDEFMEYAVLAKRLVGNTTRNEFMVVDHTGAWYAHFTEDDGKGLPYTFTILPGENAQLQMVYYDDDYNYNIDIYALPFENAATADFADKRIEGPWTFTLNGHYIGEEYSLGEFEEEFTATLDGNTVKFESTGSQYDIVAEFTGFGTLSFTKCLSGSALSTYGLWQSPYVNTYGATDLEDLRDEEFTATYDAATGTITFPANSGLRYGYFNNTTGDFSYWDDAFDFVTASYGKPSDSSVADIEAGEEGPARYFNLQGAEVKNPAPGSILIRVKNGKATKVLVK